jgi:D-psicose/D-tagatose/L-ribulose 3-epimerase
MPTEAGRQNSIAAIRRLAAKAAASGISVGLEYVNRYESNLLNTAAQTVEYIGEVGAPNVVVHLDSYHMNIEEANFRDPVFDSGDRLGYVHIGENHRGYLGQGHVNFPELFGALAEVGYDGVITFESFSSEVVDEDLSRILRIWRDMWTNGMDLAVQARRYMGDQIASAAAAGAARA